MTRKQLMWATWMTLTGGAAAFGGFDTLSELYDDLQVAQDNYSDAIDDMRAIGMDIAHLEDMLGKLFAEQATAGRDELATIDARIARVQQALAVLSPLFQDADEAMSDALLDIRQIQEAITAITKQPDIGTGG